MYYNPNFTIIKRIWFNGRMALSQGAGPGSIPGMRRFSFFKSLFKFYFNSKQIFIKSRNNSKYKII